MLSTNRLSELLELAGVSGPPFFSEREQVLGSRRFGEHGGEIHVLQAGVAHEVVDERAIGPAELGDLGRKDVLLLVEDGPGAHADEGGGDVFVVGEGAILTLLEQMVEGLPDGVRDSDRVRSGHALAELNIRVQRAYTRQLAGNGPMRQDGGALE